MVWRLRLTWNRQSPLDVESLSFIFFVYSFAISVCLIHQSIQLLLHASTFNNQELTHPLCGEKTSGLILWKGTVPELLETAGWLGYMEISNSFSSGMISCASRSWLSGFRFHYSWRLFPISPITWETHFSQIKPLMLEHRGRMKLPLWWS